MARWKLRFKVFVHGEPKAQPRGRAFARKMGDKHVARVYDPGTAEGWKSAIAAACKIRGLAGAMLTGPLRVDIEFYFPRPKAHYGTGRNAKKLKASAPEWHTNKPDRDNCEKAVLDALTQIGVMRDDSQVAAGQVLKFYANDFQPGALIRISEWEEA